MIDDRSVLLLQNYAEIAKLNFVHFVLKLRIIINGKLF